MNINNLIFHSRPRAEADWECPRSRYYAYDFEGGIVKDNLTLDLFIGTTIHDAMAAIATQHMKGADTSNVSVPIQEIARISGQTVLDTLQEYVGDVPNDSPEALLCFEQSTLVEGLILGFYKQIWPSLISQFPEIVGIEKECLFPHDTSGILNKNGPFVFMAKPDLILRGPDGLVYIEYKSTGSKKVEWIESWPHAIQVHATMKAIEFTLGEPVIGTIVQGLYKGSSYYGKFSSPMVYAYQKKGNPPFTTQQISAEYKPGFVKAPIWELDGGVSSWVQKMPAETLSEQFPQTPLIFLDEETATDFFRQRAVREESVAEVPKPVIQLDLDTYYPQSFSSCKPSFGRECNYLKICKGPAKQDPLSHGFIVKDRSHEEPYKELALELLT